MSDNLPRLRPGSPQKAQPNSNLDDRFLSFVPGAAMSFIITCGVKLSDGTATSPVVWIAVVLGILVVFGAKHVTQKFKPDFKEREGWIAIGFAVGFVVFVPLIITPRCGWWNDQCKPVQHQVRPHVK